MTRRSTAVVARSGLAIAVSVSVSMALTACGGEQTCDLKGRSNPLEITLGQDWDLIGDAYIEATCDDEECIRGSSPGTRTWTADIFDPDSFDTIHVQVLDAQTDVLFDNTMRIPWRQHPAADTCDSPWQDAKVVIPSR